MTPIDWPASLPCFRFEPYSVGPRPGAIEFDVGQLTHRARIFTQNNEAVSCELVLTSAQEQAFRTFYKTTLSMGTQWFNVDIQRNGQQEPIEALFFGAPPVFVPIAHNVVRASFTLLTRGDPLPEPVYELTASYAINIDALDFGNDAPFGETVSITTLASDKVIITKPSIVADPALTWDAWSPWASDGASPPGTGLTWINNFEVYDESNVSLLGYVNTPVVSVAAALAAAQADMPWEFTGHTGYRIGHYDPAPGDNRLGLSLRIEVYSLVL